MGASVEARVKPRLGQAAASVSGLLRRGVSAAGGGCLEKAEHLLMLCVCQTKGKQRRLLATFSPGSQAAERGGCQMRSKQYYIEKIETFPSPL